jgi:hypothetical protein
MPTMEGTEETSIGASAVPFGMIPLDAIVYEAEFKGTKGIERFDQNPCKAHGKKKSAPCERHPFWQLYFIR